MKDKLSIGLSLDMFHSLANSDTISGNFSSQIAPCSLIYTNYIISKSIHIIDYI
ncbi:hypothetical protein [Rickettsia amblyommatis]|uniref:Uncharacterized protein n=1 Tax=Rickettsia amblyommatis str. Ac/Pa TaxID=1359164 RepID=A0A0F3N459_RICAM|nr:hypothetical protein [Rickettsia amblyommatis]KJV62487.1 hypothetical protein APHACPA_1516 [Rickettsia amblyommatis str. Ac/Pa]KJV91246.1 hypothetical protein RAMDARK_1160 [Rickettsia amblyommatis str. Darkwater]